MAFYIAAELADDLAHGFDVLRSDGEFELRRFFDCFGSTVAGNREESSRVRWRSTPQRFRAANHRFESFDLGTPPAFLARRLLFSAVRLPPVQPRPVTALHDFVDRFQSVRRAGHKTGQLLVGSFARTNSVRSSHGHLAPLESNRRQ